MLVILKQCGLGSGGTNFDAKVRRESFEPIDLFHAHIGGMDAFARGLKIAAAIRKDGVPRPVRLQPLPQLRQRDRRADRERPGELRRLRAVHA